MGKYDSLREAVSGGSSDASPSSGSKYDDLRMSMGLIPDTRPKNPELTPEVINARGASEADEQYQVAHQWDNLPQEQGFIGPPAPKDNGFHIAPLDFLNNNIIEPVGNFLNRAAVSAMDALTLGQGKKQLVNNPDATSAIFQNSLRPAQTTTEKAADIVGNLYGSTAPIMGAYGTGGRLAEMGLSKIAPNAPKIIQNIVRGIGAGTAYGAAREGLDATINPDDKTGLQRLGSVGLDAAMFGGGDAALGLIGKYAGSKLGDALERWRSNKNPVMQQEAQNVLSLPNGQGEASQWPRVNNSDNPIANPYTFKLPQASESTLTHKSNMDDAFDAMHEIDNHLSSLDSQYQKAINDQYQLLKEQRNNRGGVTQGQLIRDGEGVVTDRIGRISNNPQWYQEFYKEHGKVPSNKDLYKLAQKHVNEGYSDNGVSIPSWIQENDYHGTKESLGVVREEIRNSIKEKGLNITDAQLKDQRLKGLYKPQQDTTIKQELPVTRPQTSQLAPRETNATPSIKRDPNQLGFTQTIRDSPNTSPEIAQRLRDNPVIVSRTNNAADLETARGIIQRKGIQGATQDLLSAKKVSSVDNMVAQELLHHYQNTGDVESFLSVLNKTAKENRFMGQAIQALSRWNKLDAEGASLLANKVINRGKSAADSVDLTAEQLKPVTAATEKIANTEQTKNLADEVMNIISKKSEGQEFTPEEITKLKEFQTHVNDINSKVKGFLPDKATRSRKTIEDVNKVKPKDRTNEQLKDYWEARAEVARQKLAKQNNVGLLPNTQNPVLLYAELGLAKLAKGLITAEDFTTSMLHDYGDKIKPYIHRIYDQSVSMFRKSQGLPTTTEFNNAVNAAVRNNRLDKESAAYFKGWAKEIAFFTDDKLRVEAIQDLEIALKSLGTSTLGNKIDAIQTSGMLLNTLTFERNIIGNASQLAINKVSKLATVPIDMVLSKVSGGERTIYFKSMNLEKFWLNFKKGTAAGWNGVSPSGTLDSYSVNPNTFGDKNPLRYMTKLLGASLQGFDHAFYYQAKGEVLSTYAYNLGKRKGLSNEEIKNQLPDLIKKLDSTIEELSNKAGEYATFQDENFLATGSVSLKHGLNEATTGIISRKFVKMGMPEKYSLEGFGGGSIINKFAKTPATIILRGIDYSPIGFIRSTMELAPLFYNKSKFNQFEASRALGRAITGTLGLTGMGYILADAGILTGSASLDKDQRSIEEQAGRGAYKVNWSALERFMTSGLNGDGWFNYESAKYQKGDNLMDYAWLQPAAISVAMGVNANKAVKEQKAGTDISGWQAAGTAILGGIQSILENPMVQGVSKLVDAGSDIIKKQDPTKLYNIGKSVPASFVPSALNQFRNATDNKQRETYSDNLLTEMGNLMFNKMPGASKSLPVSRDSLGGYRERVQGGSDNTVSQYLTAFFNPAKLTEYDVSPEAKLVLDIMDKSGDANVLPKIVDKYIKVAHRGSKDTRVNLTAEQYSELQKNVGGMVTGALKTYAKDLSDPQKSTEYKVGLIKKILSDTGRKARDDIGTSMGYDKAQVR